MKYSILLYILIIGSLCNSTLAQYYPYKQNGLWGFIDSKLQTVIEPQFLSAEPFVNGYSLVQDNKGFYLLNNNLESVLKHQDKIEFDVGHILSLKNDVWSIHLLNGETITNQASISKPVLYDGLYKIQTGQGFGIIDSLGTSILNNTYDAIVYSKKNFIVLKNNQSGLYSREGVILVEPQFDQVIDATPLWAYVLKGKKWGLYKKGNKLKMNCEWDDIKHFNQQFICLQKDGGNFLYDDSLSGLLTDRSFQKFVPQKKAILVWQNGKIGLISYSGEVLVEPLFHDIKEYTEDFYKVKYADKWGLYKKKVGLIIPTKYIGVERYSGSYFIGKTKKKMALYNKNGKLIIPPLYDLLFVRSDSTVCVQNDTLLGLYHIDGTKLFDPQFSYISGFEDGIGKARVNKLWSVINDNGNITEPIYKHVYYANGIVKAYSDKGLTLFYTENGALDDTEFMPNVKTISVGRSFPKVEMTNPITRDSMERRKELYHMEISEWYFDYITGKFGRRGAESGDIKMIPEYDGHNTWNGTMDMVYKDIPKTKYTLMGREFEVSRLYGIVDIAMDLEKLSCEFISIDFSTFKGGNIGIALHQTGKIYLINSYGRILTNKLTYLDDASEGAVRYCSRGRLEENSEGVIDLHDIIFDHDVPMIFSKQAEYIEAMQANEKYNPVEGYWGMYQILASSVFAYDTYLNVTSLEGGLSTLYKERGNLSVKTKNKEIVLNGKYADAKPYSLNDDTLIIVEKRRSMYGLCNAKGQIVAEQRYDKVYIPSDDRILFIMNNKYGFMNIDGKEIIENKYLFAYPFSEGLAIVKNKDGYGAIDTSGRVVIPFKFNILKPFNEGLAPYYEEGKWGFINHEGAIVIEAKYKRVDQFKENLCIAKLNSGYGIINDKGEWVLLANNQSVVGPDKRGLYKFKKGGLWGLFNPQEGKIIKPKYEDINGEEGIYVLKHKGKYRAYDSYGDVYRLKSYNSVKYFKDDYIPVMKKGKWGFLDASLDLAIDLQYRKIYDWNSNIFIAKRNISTDIVSFDGGVLFTTDDHFVSLEKGFIVFRNSYNELYFVNQQGQVLPEQFKDYKIINYEYAFIKKGDLWYSFNLKNNIVSNYSFENTLHYDEKYVKVERKYSQALYTSNGKAKCKFMYEEMIPLSADMIMVKVDSKVGYINSDNNIIFNLLE